MSHWSTMLALALFAGCPALASDFYIELQGGVSEFDGIADTGGTGPGPIQELPINGLPFESSESTWSALGGWQLRDWIAVEAGYTDLGESSREQLRAFGLSPGPISFFSDAIALNVDQWFLGTRLSTALSDSILADWSLGVARSEFDVDGSVPIFGSPEPVPPRIPYASPGAETGLVWGFGFRWQMNPRFSVGLNYRQHNTGVIDVETFTAGLRLSL